MCTRHLLILRSTIAERLAHLCANESLSCLVIVCKPGSPEKPKSPNTTSGIDDNLSIKVESVSRIKLWRSVLVWWCSPLKTTFGNENTKKSEGGRTNDRHITFSRIRHPFRRLRRKTPHYASLARAQYYFRSHKIHRNNYYIVITVVR